MVEIITTKQRHGSDRLRLDICTSVLLCIPFYSTVTIEDKLNRLLARSVADAKHNQRLYFKLFRNLEALQSFITYPNNLILNNGTCDIQILEASFFIKSQGFKCLYLEI